jgi:hypothetical protein
MAPEAILTSMEELLRRLESSNCRGSLHECQKVLIKRRRLNVLYTKFGRISVIFGQECTRGWIAGGSVLWFNSGIVRRALRRGARRYDPIESRWSDNAS